MEDIPPIPAWLASGRTDYSPAPGMIELSGGRIRFTVTGPPGEKTAQWLEQVTGQQGLAERVLAGDATEVLDVDAGEVKPKFPALMFGASMQIKHAGTTYRIFFYNAGKAASQANKTVAGASSQLQGRVAGKPWKDAF